jgi:hypothetical protein
VSLRLALRPSIVQCLVVHTTAHENTVHEKERKKKRKKEKKKKETCSNDPQCPSSCMQ